MNNKWYAIHLSSDALKPKQMKVGWVGPLGGRYLHPVAAGKLTIQHSANELGVELYIPWETKEITHHRTKKQVDRDFPMIPGYAFVSGVNDFYALDQAVGVRSIMSDLNFVPLEIPPKDIFKVRMAEWELYQLWVKHNRPVTRKVLQERFSKDEEIKFRTELGISGKSKIVGFTGRKTIKVMTEMLGRMVPVELPVSALEAAE